MEPNETGAKPGRVLIAEPEAWSWLSLGKVMIILLGISDVGVSVCSDPLESLEPILWP